MIILRVPNVGEITVEDYEKERVINYLKSIFPVVICEDTNTDEPDDVLAA